MACMDAGVRRRITLLAKATKKESCVICLDDDIDSDLMFLVGRCVHRFCFNCVKKHIQVKLFDGTLPDCPQHRCKTQLSIDRCNELLTPKLSLMWEQRIEEDSLPLCERVYCPYKSCGYLMSKTDLSSSVEFGLRRCFKCRGFFCVDCKVPWHSRLSCTDYKKLHSNPQNDNDDVKLKSLAKLKGWRQCSKCQHMVERSYGCNHMTCRCGNEFCYECGAKWNSLPGYTCCITRSYDHNEILNALERNRENLNAPERNRVNSEAICFFIFIVLLLMFLWVANLVKRVITTIS